MNKKMKKVILVIIVVMVISFGISGALFIQSGKNIINIGKNQADRKAIDLIKTIEQDHIEKLYIDMTSADVQLIAEDRKDMKIHFYGETNGEIPKLNVERKNKELLINIEDEKAFYIQIGK